MNHAFAGLVDPIIAYVTKLQGEFAGPPGGHPGLAEVRAEALRLIEAARSRAARPPRQANYADLAERALVYWVDDVLINSEWTHAEEWRTRALLEQALYGETEGGDKFYDKADEARQRGAADALEVFFVCVALGFRGKHAGHSGRQARWSAPSEPARKLGRWVERVYPLVCPTVAEFLPDTDAPEAPDGGAPWRGLLLLVSALASFTILSTLAAWVAAEHLW